MNARIVATLVCSVLLASTAPSLAQTSYTWTGGSGINSHFNESANWHVGLGTPINGDLLVFAGTTRLDPLNLNGSPLTSVASITFEESAGAFTVTGAGTGQSLTVTGGIANKSANLQIVGFNLTVSASQSFSATADDLTFTGTIAISGSNTLTVTGANNTLMSNIISGGSGNLTKSGAGTLTVSASNSYGGSTSITGGTLLLSTGSDRLPTGTTVSLGDSGGTGLGTLDLNGNSQQIAGLNSVSGTNATSNNNLVTSSSAATLTITGSGSFGAGTDANSGVIAGSISLVKSGTGTQTLGDANTYTGTTTISGGTLKLGANGSITSSPTIRVDSGASFDVADVTGGFSVVSGQTVAGRGTVLGTVGVESGGTLKPGEATNTGVLTINNSVTMDSGSSLELRINGNTVGDGSASTGYDRLTITSGNFVIANEDILDFLGGYTPATTDALLVVNNTGTGTISINGSSSGTFIRDIGGFAWFVHFGTAANAFGGTDGNDIVLTPVPEPSQVFAAGLAVFGVLGVARRRLRRRTAPVTVAAA